MKATHIYFLLSLHQVLSTNIGRSTDNTKYNVVQNTEPSKSPYMNLFQTLYNDETKRNEVLKKAYENSKKESTIEDNNGSKRVKSSDGPNDSHIFKISPKNRYYSSNSNQLIGAHRARLNKVTPGCHTNNVTKPSPSSKEDVITEAKRFAHLASTSYCDDDGINLWSCSHCLKSRGLKLLKIVYEPGHNLRSIILLDHNKKDLIISFRGSDGVGQAFSLMSLSTVQFLSQDNVRVHKKIKERAIAIFNHIYRALLPVLEKYGCYRKVLIGHSLGGAMATLIAPMMNVVFDIPYHDMAVYTFGQPRVGNADFAIWYNSLNIHTIRVVNGRDSIPHSLGYPNFVHTHRELFIYYGDTLCSTSSLEDENCSNFFTFHSVYFPTHNSVWGIRLGNDNC